MNLPDIHRSRGVQLEAAEQRRQCEVPSMDFRGNQGKSTSFTGISAISMGLVTTMAGCWRFGDSWSNEEGLVHPVGGYTQEA